MVSVEKRWPVGSPYRGGTYNYRAFTQNVNGHRSPTAAATPRPWSATRCGRLIGKYGATGHPWFIWATPVAPHFGGPPSPTTRRPTGPRPAPVAVRDPGPSCVGAGSLRRVRSPTRRAPASRAPSERDVTDKPVFMQQAAGGHGRRAGCAARGPTAARGGAVRLGPAVRPDRAAPSRTTGQYDDTVIVFTSDNGYFSGEHRQRLGKIKPYEPSLRVPLVVAGPGHPARRPAGADQHHRPDRHHPRPRLGLTAARRRRRLEGAGVCRRPAVERAGRDRGPADAAPQGRRRSRAGSPRWGCAPAATPSSATAPATASSTTCSATRWSCARTTTTRRTPGPRRPGAAVAALPHLRRRRLSGSAPAGVPGLGGGWPIQARPTRRRGRATTASRTRRQTSGSSGCLCLRSRSRRKSRSSSGATGRPAGGAAGTSLLAPRRRDLGRAHDQVDRQRQQGDEDHDLQHATRVGGWWSASTLIS